MNSSEYRQQNRKAWNEATALHLDQPTHALSQLLQGASTLDKIEAEELGDVRGLKVLHLLCNCGHDTLSLVKQGAICTGVDIADAAIKAATHAASKLYLPARFIRSDVYDLCLGETFDIVYTGKGALYWLDDLDAFAQKVAGLLTSGGRFYIYEEHPLLPLFHELEPTPYNPAIGSFTYFHRQSPNTTVGLDYVGLSGKGSEPAHEWQWTLGDVVTAIVSAGLRVDFLREWPFSFLKYWDCLEDDNGSFRIPLNKPQLPLSFSLQASQH